MNIAMLLGLKQPFPLPAPKHKPAQYRMLTVVEIEALVIECLECGPATEGDLVNWADARRAVIISILKRLSRCGRVERRQFSTAGRLHWAWVLLPGAQP